MKLYGATNIKLPKIELSIFNADLFYLSSTVMCGGEYSRKWYLQDGSFIANWMNDSFFPTFKFLIIKTICWIVPFIENWIDPQTEGEKKERIKWLRIENCTENVSILWQIIVELVTLWKVFSHFDRYNNNNKRCIVCSNCCAPFTKLEHENRPILYLTHHLLFR